MQALRKAKAALPDDPAILSALGALYLANDQPTEAISVLRQAFSLTLPALQSENHWHKPI